MPRPAWFDKAPDVQAVATHLQQLADTAKATWRFEPLPVPAGTDFSVLHQAALARARSQLTESHAEKDRILSQEVRAIDDLVRTANLLVERLREWYALHAPEATRRLNDPEQLARLVAEHGDRASVVAALGEAESATSLGSDLSPGDMEVLQGFAAALSAVHASWHGLEKRVADLMQEVAPNVAAITGPVLGARLIAISGGLARLAMWPTGTVQTLGAETALFRHLKEGSLPPKHGILFQHPLVHQAPTWQRGPIARAIALATSTAAKADAFTRNDLRVHLQAQLKSDLDRVARDRAKPKPKPWGAKPSFRSGGPRRGPPGRGPPSRGPPSRGPGRGPSREGSWSGPPARAPAPRAEGGWSRAPSRDNAPPARAWGAPQRDGPRDGPRDAPRDGPRDAPRDGPRQGEGFGPRPGSPGGPRSWGGGGTGGGYKPRRKPQGAFRSENQPAKPPGRTDDKGLRGQRKGPDGGQGAGRNEGGEA